ncbi:MAG: hypothetical protein AB1414_12275 [bacterium]
MEIKEIGRYYKKIKISKELELAYVAWLIELKNNAKIVLEK